MKMKTNSQAFLRKRKFFMALPLLALPFLTLLFWALGGGKVSSAQAEDQKAMQGLNPHLPDAYLKEDKPLNKLSYYEKAASDSAKLQELMRNDPYYKMHALGYPAPLPAGVDSSLLSIRFNKTVTSNNLNAGPYSKVGKLDENEAKVYQKLEQLNAVLNEVPVRSSKTHGSLSPAPTSARIDRSDLDRLEQLMDITRSAEKMEDPEMTQLNGMMEKILDIQHPERVKERTRDSSDVKKQQIYHVRLNDGNDNVSLLTNNQAAGKNNERTDSRQSTFNGFFSLDEEEMDKGDDQNALTAVVSGTQTLVDGAIIKLRLTKDVSIKGVTIPKENFIFGKASLNGERLNIQINSIRYKSSVFPVQLHVFDLDGLDGIYIPGAITRDVAKQSADNSLQGIDFTSLNPSIGAQAANAGIQAAKSLLSKKVKLVKVTVKSGYQVLLRDANEQSSL